MKPTAQMPPFAALFRGFALACAFLLAFAAPARATTVVPLYLDEIVDRAAVAFEGTCVETHAERDAATGFVATFTTFQVDDALKGPVGSSYTIKQIGGSLPDQGFEYRVPGVPKFTPGERYVVFLAGVSSIGFSSPVGLSQGKFAVFPGATGGEVANGRDFKEMTARIPVDQLPAQARAKMAAVPGPARRMDLADFKQLVRQVTSHSQATSGAAK